MSESRPAIIPAPKTTRTPTGFRMRMIGPSEGCVLAEDPGRGLADAPVTGILAAPVGDGKGVALARGFHAIALLGAGEVARVGHRPWDNLSFGDSSRFGRRPWIHVIGSRRAPSSSARRS